MQLHKLRLHIVLLPRTLYFCAFLDWFGRSKAFLFYFVYHICLSRNFPHDVSLQFDSKSRIPCTVYLSICRGAAVVAGPSPREAIRNISFQDNWVANTFGTNGLKMRILTWILDTLPFFQLHNMNRRVLSASPSRDIFVVPFFRIWAHFLPIRNAG